MKQRLLSVWTVLAGIVFFLLPANATKANLGINFLLGCIAGGLIVRIRPGFPKPRPWIKAVVCVAAELILLRTASELFFKTWASEDAVQALLGRFFSGSTLPLRVLGGFLAVFSFPFVHIVVCTALERFVRMVKSIRWAKIWTGKRVGIASICKAVGIALLNLAAAAGLGLILLIAVYRIPMDGVASNTEVSARQMEAEGTYPDVFRWCTSQLDHFTDSIMLLEASDTTDAPVLERALMAYRGHTVGRNPWEVLVDRYVYGVEFGETADYARYWHGYLLFLKPLLKVTDYGTLCTVNGALQTALLIAVCLLMRKRGIGRYAIPCILLYLLLMPVALARSFQFSPCCYGMLLVALLLLMMNDGTRRRYAWIVFLNTGVFTAFYDYLTYPLATFGVPAAVLLALTAHDEPEARLRSMAENGIAWCFGYGGMWGFKWVLTAVFTDYDIFSSAMGAVAARTAFSSLDGGTRYSVMECAFRNFNLFLNTPAAVIAFGAAACMILYLTGRKAEGYDRTRCLIPYALLAVSPVVWFLFATNHAMDHAWFANKCCVNTAAAVLFGLTECVCRTQGVRNQRNGGV